MEISVYHWCQYQSTTDVTISLPMMSASSAANRDSRFFCSSKYEHWYRNRHNQPSIEDYEELYRALNAALSFHFSFLTLHFSLLASHFSLFIFHFPFFIFNFSFSIFHFSFFIFSTERCPHTEPHTNSHPISHTPAHRTGESFSK